jgi:hypothetical protein
MLIAGVVIWSIIVTLHLDGNCENLYKNAYIGAILLILALIARVIHIFLIPIYICCIMPCLFLPNYCPCHRLLLGDDYDETIIEEVEKNQWTYNEEAM